MDGFNDPRKGNNRTYRRTINIENPKGDIFYLFDRRYKSYISPSFFRCRGENDNRESCGELSSNLSHLISAASRIQDLRRLVVKEDRKDDRKHEGQNVSIFPSYLGPGMKFSGVGRKGEPFNWTEALTRVSLIRKGMVSRLWCARVQIRKLWMNRYLPFMRLTNAANISKLCPVPLNTNWYFKIFALPSLHRVGMKWTWNARSTL